MKGKVHDYLELPEFVNLVDFVMFICEIFLKSNLSSAMAVIIKHTGFISEAL